MGQYNINQAQPMRLGIQYSPDIHRIKPCDLPTTLLRVAQGQLDGHIGALLDLLPNSSSNDDKEFWEIEVPAEQAFSAACESPATACEAVVELAVDRANAARRGDLYRNISTGELVVVMERISDFKVKMKRGQGSLGSLPININDKFVFIGNTSEQASTRGTPVTTTRSRIYNRYAISREPWGMAKTAACVQKGLAAPVGAQLSNKLDSSISHLNQIERMLWMSEMYEGEMNGKPITRFDGFDSSIRKYAPENIFIAPEHTDYGTFTEWLNTIRMGTSYAGFTSPDMLLVGGYRAIQTIQDMIRLDGDKVRLENGTGQAYGMTYSTIVTITGRWHIMHNNFFDTEPSLANSLRVVNLKSMRIKYLCDRKHQYTPYDGADGDAGLDALGGDWLSEYAFQMLAPKTNGIIYNLCAAGCRPACVYTKWEPNEMAKDDCGRVVPVLSDEDGQLLWTGKYNNCPTEGFDPVFLEPDQCLDKCGNPICPPNCEDYAAWACVKCSQLTVIHTSDGDIDFSNLDWSKETAADDATALLNQWMTEDFRSGSGTITIEKGVVTVAITEYAGFEFLDFDEGIGKWGCIKNGACCTDTDECADAVVTDDAIVDKP